MLSQKDVEYLSWDSLIHTGLKVFTGTAFDANGCGCEVITQKINLLARQSDPMARTGMERCLSTKCGRKNSMIEIRMHGRGGQGAVIAAKILASAIFKEGKIRAVISFIRS